MPNAAFVGSFDPWTRGHHHVLVEAIKLFDEVSVLVARNSNKSGMLHPEERADAIERSRTPYERSRVKVYVLPPNVYAARAAWDLNCTYLVRGVRGAGDAEYEQVLADANSRLAPGIRTVLFPTPLHLAGISSSAVRAQVGPEGWESVVSHYVDPAVVEVIKKKVGGG